MSDPATIDVLITEDVWGPALDDLATRARVIRRPAAWSDPDELAHWLPSSRALLVRNRTRVSAELLARAPHLQIVARAGVGLDNIDLAAADNHGIVVSAPRGANAVSVAEHALALALTLARNITRLDADCRAGGWDRHPGIELLGRTWGLLGAGATARACARLAGAFGMKVLAYDPYLDPGDPGLAATGIELAPLARVLDEADVISCHLPASDATTGMIDAALLARMKASALFINVGRGEVVDEHALADALENGELAGAALDVRVQEPPARGRLEKLDNVVLTPHVAGLTAESQTRIVRILAADIEAVLAGREAHSAAGSLREHRR